MEPPNEDGTCAPNAKRLQDQLEAQLSVKQKVLVQHHAALCWTARQVEQEMSDLRGENQRLRRELESADKDVVDIQAGTGEASAPQTWVQVLQASEGPDARKARKAVAFSDSEEPAGHPSALLVEPSPQEQIEPEPRTYEASIECGRGSNTAKVANMGANIAYKVQQSFNWTKSLTQVLPQDSASMLSLPEDQPERPESYTWVIEDSMPPAPCDSQFMVPMFIDAEAMKENIRSAINKPEYNVVNMYHSTGVWQKIAKSRRFEVLTYVMVAVNSVWLAVDADHNKESELMRADAIFQVAEHMFCTYFLCELAIRFMAFKQKRVCLKDYWFVIDLSLLVLMVAETWLVNLLSLAGSSMKGVFLHNAGVLRIGRLLRLCRVARVVRVLRVLPELMILVKGMVMAGRSVIVTFILLTIFVYTWAITFVQLLQGSPAGKTYFHSVPRGMVSLLLHGCLGEDLPDMVFAVSDVHVLYGFWLMIYVLIAALTVMNMLIGVMVEVVSLVASCEKERLTVQLVYEKLHRALVHIDTNDDDKISAQEFRGLLSSKECAQALQDLGVDAVGLVDFADFIFTDQDAITFSDFMEIVLKLRGKNVATVKDIVDLRKVFAMEVGLLHKSILEEIRMLCQSDAASRASRSSKDIDINMSVRNSVFGGASALQSSMRPSGGRLRGSLEADPENLGAPGDGEGLLL